MINYNHIWVRIIYNVITWIVKQRIHQKVKKNENNKNFRIDEIADCEDCYVDNNIVTSWGYK